MRTIQNSPQASRVGVTDDHDNIMKWGTPRVLRIREFYVYKTGVLLLRSVSRRICGNLLGFRSDTTPIESCISATPVDLLVLDEPVWGLERALRRVPWDYGHATAVNTTASERLTGMLWKVAIRVDNDQISIDMLISLITNIAAVPPSHIIFLCDDAQLREVVANVPTDQWGLRAIENGCMASYKDQLFVKAKTMIGILWEHPEVPKHMTYSFAVDWDHHGLTPYGRY